MKGSYGVNEIIIRGPRSSSDTNLSAMRFHELAVQHWLNKVFQVQDGYPVPVIFAPVMDAFSQFQNLWKDPNNPFAYLLDLKDFNGQPLYEPYPANIRYPLLSVQRKDWTFRNSQNYTLHPARIYGWATDVDNPTRNDLAYVIQRQRPMAWDFKYQIDFLCLRPDTQAYFVECLMGEFWRSGGPEPQTWIYVPYPEWFGTKYVRVKLVGQPQNMTQEAPLANSITEFRTSITVVVEGYKLDADYDLVPAFWKLKVNSTAPMAPHDLAWVFGGAALDLRSIEQNEVLNTRSPLPPKGPVIVTPTFTTAYDDFSLYEKGLANQQVLSGGVFLKDQWVFYPTDGATEEVYQPRIIDYTGQIPTAVPSRALEISKSSMVRKLSLGSFTKVRVAMTCTLSPSGSLDTSELFIGLCDSSGDPVGLGLQTKLFMGFFTGLGFVYNNDYQPPVTVFTGSANGDTPYELTGIWTDDYIGETPTSQQPYLAPWSGTHRRSTIIVDIEVVNSTTFQIQAYFLDMDLARVDITDPQFSSLVQQPSGLSLDGVLLQNTGSVSITSGTPYGTLDAINICWNDSSGSYLLVHSVAAVKLQ